MDIKTSSKTHPLSVQRLVFCHSEVGTAVAIYGDCFENKYSRNDNNPPLCPSDISHSGEKQTTY